jgi:hypothetical protein
MDVDKNDLLKALAQIVNRGAAKKTRGAKKARGPLTEEQKAAYRAQNDAECVKIFTAKGYSDVQPRVNVMTYNKWIEAGRKVKKGEKSIKVGGFSLFHKNQTEEIVTQLPVSAAESVTKH